MNPYLHFKDESSNVGNVMCRAKVHTDRSGTARSQNPGLQIPNFIFVALEHIHCPAGK